MVLPNGIREVYEVCALGALGSRHKHKIAEAFVPGHVDGRVGWHLFELEPLGCLHHVRSNGPI
jgi:hypothetical protein